MMNESEKFLHYIGKSSLPFLLPPSLVDFTDNAELAGDKGEQFHNFFSSSSTETDFFFNIFLSSYFGKQFSTNK
jgi:hypothetical protein